MVFEDWKEKQYTEISPTLLWEIELLERLILKE